MSCIRRYKGNPSVLVFFYYFGSVKDVFLINVKIVCITHRTGALFSNIDQLKNRNHRGLIQECHVRIN